MNEAREEKQDKRLAEMKLALEQQMERTQQKRDLNIAADALILKVLKGIDDLVR